MSNFIAVDLKVIEVLAPMAARSAGITEDRALAGLVRLWHRCWSTTSDTVTLSQLAGIFGGERIAELAEVLCTDFLERTTEGFRVRGGERYLRLKAARRLGAMKTNAARSKSVAPERSQSDAERALPDALSPNTEHRTPKKEEDPETLARSGPQLELVGEKPKTRPSRKPPNPEEEFQRFANALTADEASVFESYETHMGVRLGADGGLLKLVRARLKAHPASELCAAIKGHASDPWKREHSPGLRGILRDATIIATSAAKAGAA